MRFLWFLLHLVVVSFTLWAVGALWFDLPLSPALRHPTAVVFGLITLTLWFIGRPATRLTSLILLSLLTIWWFRLAPSNDRPWQPDVARTAWAEIKGDEVTFHNLRNIDYRSATDFTEHWETRTVRISQLTGLDLGINYWGSEAMAHPIASFQFADARPVCFSIETRREIGETYSAIGGLYRQYELLMIVADERDVVRVRTNFKGEDVYLYRLTLTPEQVRERFLEYVSTLNELHQSPRWYNAITQNCTTSIRRQHTVVERRPWDWRILVNGYADQMLYEDGSVKTGGRPFEELKKSALINDLAKAANNDPDFSTRIRQRLPTP